MTTRPLPIATLHQLLETSVRSYGSRPALGMALEKPLSYDEFFAAILSARRTLEEQGLRKGDKVALLGENSPNWGIAYFAILRLGAVVVPILPDFPEADVHHILKDSECRGVLVSSRLAEKVAGFPGNRLQCVINLDDFRSRADMIEVEPLTRFLDKARTLLRRIPEFFGLTEGEAGPGDLAAIIYTSGTSGHSKAVMLSHRNFVANVLSSDRLVDIHPGDTFLSILPLSHTYEFTLGFLLPLFNGARVAYVGRTPNPTLLERICRQERPEFIVTVPLLLEKIYKKKVLSVIEKNVLTRWVTRTPLLRDMVFKRIRQRLVDFFGGHLKLMAIGGAPINGEVEKFLRVSGYPYLIGYGMTEGSPLLSGGPMGDRTIEVGSAGKPIPGVEIRIDRPDERSGVGEILARGANVMMGYYQNPGLTAETIDRDGWLYTGDLGRFDRRGNLHVVGRSKNVIVLANGENVYTEVVEDKLNASIYVSESLLIDRSGRLEAWVYLDYDLVDAETRGRSEAERGRHIKDLLERIRQDVNAQLPVFAQILRIEEQNEPFEKTPTHKIKRHLYAHRGEV